MSNVERVIKYRVEPPIPRTFMPTVFDSRREAESYMNRIRELFDIQPILKQCTITQTAWEEVTL